MYKKFIFLLLAIALINLLKCNTISDLHSYLVSTAKFSEKMVQNMIYSNQNILVTIKKDTFINPNGTQMLFNVRKGKIQRIDQCQLHGFNFNRFLFSHQGNIYTLGGYGFYTSNKILQKFNFQSHEWDFIPVNNNDILQFGILGIMYKSKNSIICIKNIVPGNIIVPDKLENEGYSLDLNTFSISKLSIDTSLLTNFNFRGDYKITQTNSFLLYCKQNQTFIINKSMNQFIMVPNNMYHLWTLLKSDINIQGDTLYVSNLTLSDSVKNISINLPQIWQDAYFVKTSIMVVKDDSILDTVLSYLLIVLIVLLLVGLGWFLNYFKHRPLLSQKENLLAHEPHDYIIENLINHNFSKVTSDQLDEIFGIAHMEINSRKTKRNRIIEKVNNQFPGAIQRNRDNNDRRIIIYNIQLG